MMSSRLGLTAEVIATESPSQERPVVIQITCASTASVVVLVGDELGRCHLNSPIRAARARVPHRVVRASAAHQQILGSGSPTSRSITRLPPKAVSTSTIPGGSVLTSPISAAPSRPGTARSAASAASARLGRDERDEPALVGDVHRVDPEDLGRAGDGRAGPARRPRGRRSRRRDARASSLRTVATPPRVASRMQRRPAPAALEQRVGRRPQRAGVGHDVGVELELVAGEHDRRPVLADRAGDEDRVAGARAPRARALRAVVDTADARSC